MKMKLGDEPTYRTSHGMYKMYIARKQETNLSLGQEHIGYDMREAASQHGDDVVSVSSDDLGNLPTDKYECSKA